MRKKRRHKLPASGMREDITAESHNIKKTTGEYLTLSQ